MPPMHPTARGRSPTRAVGYPRPAAPGALSCPQAPPPVASHPTPAECRVYEGRAGGARDWAPPPTPPPPSTQPPAIQPRPLLQRATRPAATQPAYGGLTYVSNNGSHPGVLRPLAAAGATSAPSVVMASAIPPPAAPSSAYTALPSSWSRRTCPQTPPRDNAARVPPVLKHKDPRKRVRVPKRKRRVQFGAPGPSPAHMHAPRHTHMDAHAHASAPVHQRKRRRLAEFETSKTNYIKLDTTNQRDPDDRHLRLFRAIQRHLQRVRRLRRSLSSVFAACRLREGHVQSALSCIGTNVTAPGNSRAPRYDPKNLYEIDLNLAIQHLSEISISRRASIDRRGRHTQLLAEVDSTTDLLELVLEHLLNLDA